MDDVALPVDELFEAEVLDQAGERLGTLQRVFLDDETGLPAWGTVSTGWFGGRHSVVPLANAEVGPGLVRVPYPASQVRDAPFPEAEGHLDPPHLAALLSHYTVGTGAAPSA